MIRQIQADDLKQVMEIWLSGNEDAHPFIPKEYWKSNFEAVREAIAQAEVFVCEENGEILGFIGLTGEYIAGIFVRRACRSRGVGKRLLEDAKANHHSLSLNVYRKNERAAAFYAREGFCVTAQGTDEDTGEDEYTMRWQAEK